MPVLDLDDVKSYLKLKDNVDTYDAEVQAIMDAAEAAIAQRVGPLEPTTVTLRLAGGRYVRSLALSTLPVLSLTSITPVGGGDPIDLDTLHVDLPSGVIEYDLGCQAFPLRHYTIVYQAGRTECPADLILAAKELVRHLWQTQRGPTRANSPTSEATSNTVPGAAYLMPFRVSELIAPHLLLPGFA